MTSSSGVVYQNAEVFVKILRDCGLPQVANWKSEDVKRALDWVQYFQKVNKHVVSKSSAVAKLECKVKEIGRSLSIRFGQDEASFNFLVNKSLQYCLQTLLANPVLPDQLRQYILSHHSDIVEHYEVENKREQVLFTTLSQIHGVLTDSMPEDDLALALHSLDASYLRADITWLLQATDCGTHRSNVVTKHAKLTAEKRLSSLAQIDGGMEVILLALLQNSTCTGLITGPVQYSAMDPTRKFILEWLVEVARSWGKDESRNTSESGESLLGNSGEKLGHFLWSRSHSKLLVRLSAAYFVFFKEHLKHLIFQTNKLNWGLDSTNLMKQDTSVESQEWIVSQWVELVDKGQPIRDVVLDAIKSQAFPRAKSEEHSQLHSEVGFSLDYWSPVPPSGNVWIEILKNVNKALKEQ